MVIDTIDIQYVYNGETVLLSAIKEVFAQYRHRFTSLINKDDPRKARKSSFCTLFPYFSCKKYSIFGNIFIIII